MLSTLSNVAKKSLARSSASIQQSLFHPNRAAGAAVIQLMQQQKRFLNVHEYISMELMASHGIKTPECYVAETSQEVEHIFATSFHQKCTLWDLNEFFCI
jgi:acyl-CoA synthetase (NDP forming)